MKLPQLNLRIPEPHHDLIRQIAHILRESHGDAFAADLNQWLNDRPGPVSDTDTLCAVSALHTRMNDLETRLGELEGWRQKLTDPEPLAPYEPAGQVIERARNEYIPEHICSQAHGLKIKGMTWEAVWKALGEPATVNGLRNAVGKWRKRYRVKVED